MIKLPSIVNRLRADRKGVTALEYGLIAGVLLVVVLGGFTVMGDSLSNRFQTLITDPAGDPPVASNGG